MAKHSITGKRYVVKLLPLEHETFARRDVCDPMSITDDDARRVLAEADVLKLASDHPNIVRFHGAFRREIPSRTSHSKMEASIGIDTIDPMLGSTSCASSRINMGHGAEKGKPRKVSELCIVMSHCEGGDLASLLRRVRSANERLPEEAVMRWLVQLLLGLHHIHRKAILHRDIKPANVFLSKSRKVVRLGDFGIAKKLREDDDLAATVVGTPLYMSPELCQGKPYTYASDIWALGCVLYEMASGGVKAFDAPGWPQLLVKIVRCEYAPIPSHFSRPFASLLAAMLSPDPADRMTTEQLLNAPIVRRHCEALLRDAKERRGEGAGNGASESDAGRSSSRLAETPDSARMSSRVSRVSTNPSFGASGVPDATRRASRASLSANASAVADAEKKAAAEARYAARQTALRRDRMAVRDADPKRAAARHRADAEAEKRMARQEARAVSEAEEALLARRGYARERERVIQVHGETKEGSRMGRQREEFHENANPATNRTTLREAAFASRPRIERTDVSGVSVGPMRSIESPAFDGTTARDPETASMEALLAEARDDREIETRGVGGSSAEAMDSETASKLVTMDMHSTSVPEDCTIQSRVRIAPERVSSFAAASAAAALLGSRAETAPEGASRFSPQKKTTSSSFEWPPPASTSERQASKDAALEKRVRARLRTFLREEALGSGGSSGGSVSRDGGVSANRDRTARPSTAVGTSDSRCETLDVDRDSSVKCSDDDETEGSYRSDDFENSGEFEEYFEEENKGKNF